MLFIYPRVQVKDCFPKVTDLPKAAQRASARAKREARLVLKTSLSFQNHRK